MKIVVLGTRGFPNVQGGVEKHCENLYPRLVKKGCEVVVFTRKPYVDSALDNYKGVKLIPLPCPKNKFLEAFLHTFKGVFAAKKIKPDILHIHAVGPSLFVPLARLLGLKVVMTHHGPDYQRQKWNKIAKFALHLGEKWGCYCVNAVICISESIAQGVREKYARDVVVIPNGVVLPELKSEIASSAPSALPRNDGAPGIAPFFQRFGVEKGKYVLAVSRFVPEKGLHDLIEAFKIAKDDGQRTMDEWKLVIAGDADHEDVYSRKVKEKTEKNPNIVLTGFLSGQPLAELYSNAGLFVLPSYYEGLPIVLLEAMSYGLSCVVSDISANREVELSEDRFFAPGDVQALASKIKEFMDKPLRKLERMKQAQMMAQKYDWERIAEKTLEVYRTV